VQFADRQAGGMYGRDGDMRALSHIEQDDFDRWVGWILATATRDAYPSRVVWHRIVTCLINSDERLPRPRRGTGKDRGFEMAV
jgi:hypothetical protein